VPLTVLLAVPKTFFWFLIGLLQICASDCNKDPLLVSDWSVADLPLTVLKTFWFLIGLLQICASDCTEDHLLVSDWSVADLCL
jgi:hypothetical protein